MKKENLSDVTFIIPYFRDSQEREENLICILNFLESNFNTNITLINCGPTLFPTWKKRYLFEPVNDGVFHRTKVLNRGIKDAQTPYIAIYDTDVIFDIYNILKAVIALRMGATLTYPYSGEFIDIKRSYIQDGVIIERESFATGSVGGACFINREDYWRCGLENENYLSHCPDDVDRYYRIKTLGYKVERIPGKCWHISHPPSANSGVNKFTEANTAEWLKIKEMNKEQLTEYISTWPWAKK
jgi:hypothetical protein